MAATAAWREAHAELPGRSLRSAARLVVEAWESTRDPALTEAYEAIPEAVRLYWSTAAKNARSLAWKKAHPEAFKEHCRRSDARHPERVREARRRAKKSWKARHPEKWAERKRRYNAAHPEKRREHEKRRKERLRLEQPEHWRELQLGQRLRQRENDHSRYLVHRNEILTKAAAQRRAMGVRATCVAGSRPPQPPRAYVPRRARA